MRYDRSQVAQVAFGALGAVVGGVTGWTFGGAAGYTGWAAGLIFAYVAVIGVSVVTFEHDEGVLRGLAHAAGRAGWFFVGLAVWLVLLALLVIPFVLLVSLIQENSAAAWVFDHLPAASKWIIQSVFVAVSVAALGVLIKTEAGLATVSFAFRGLLRGLFVIAPVFAGAMVAIGLFGLVAVIDWVSGGWPHAPAGPILGLALGVIGGAVLGYLSAFLAWLFEDVDGP